MTYFALLCIQRHPERRPTCDSAPAYRFLSLSAALDRACALPSGYLSGETSAPLGLSASPVLLRAATHDPALQQPQTQTVMSEFGSVQIKNPFLRLQTCVCFWVQLDSSKCITSVRVCGVALYIRYKCALQTGHHICSMSVCHC